MSGDAEGLGLAADAAVCVQQIGEGPVAQKYLREA